MYRWIDGVTLNECRRREPPSTLTGLGEPLGRLAAAVANAPAEQSDGLPSRRVIDEIATAGERLAHGLARARLGVDLADQLRRRFDSAGRRLEAADRSSGLAHGDFGGRNLIVTPSDGGDWRVAGLLDWEHSFVGSPLWDVGSLFRYAQRYSTTFRDRFAGGYREGGGILSDDWHLAARLLDATRIVGILSSVRELPDVFPECRESIASLVTED